MAQYVFGAGQLYATPLIDGSGNTITNPTPIRLGAFQEGGFDFSFEVKTLYGQSQFPIAQGRGKGKVSIKTKFAQINGLALNTLFFGQTLSTGQNIIYRDTTGTAIPTTPFTIQPTIPSSGTWVADMGVIDTSTGFPMTRVAGPTPSTLQYVLDASTHTYTFASADNGSGKSVYIDYAYSVTTGKHINVANILMGQIPVFKADLFVPYIGKYLVISLLRAVGTKMTMATKLDDFMVPEFDMDGFDDGTGQVAVINTSE